MPRLYIRLNQQAQGLFVYTGKCLKPGRQTPVMAGNGLVAATISSPNQARSGCVRSYLARGCCRFHSATGTNQIRAMMSERFGIGHKAGFLADGFTDFGSSAMSAPSRRCFGFGAQAPNRAVEPQGSLPSSLSDLSRGQE
jgi:hypothetical protein